jgi:hypothetical protein
MAIHHHHHEDPTRAESESERDERDRANSDRRALTPEEQEEQARRAAETPATGRSNQNPPRTTTDGLTAPKFGSAGSGGLEFEPGPERD